MITIQQCTKNDVMQLKEVSEITFYETFAPQNPEAIMQDYMEKAFSHSQLLKELKNPYSAFFLLFYENELAGYLKLNQGDAQTEPLGDTTLEIERIYVKQMFQGKGLGNVLYNLALDIAGKWKKSSIWLGVWEKNEHAIGFYSKHGFVKSGEHSFFMGEDEQTDYIMTKELKNERAK